MSLTEANRKYFDAISDSYDSKPWFAKVNQQVTDHLRSRLGWVGIPFASKDSSSSPQEIRFLDYACGPGIMSRIYGPYVTVTRGIDLSPNMVETYNARARTAGLAPSTIHAVVGDLFAKDPAPEFSTPEFQHFDLAAAGFAFHHFEDVVHAARRLKERLRPGGVLVISDFLEGGDMRADEHGDPIQGSEGNHFHHTHHHHHGHHEQSQKQDHSPDHTAPHAHGHSPQTENEDDPTRNVHKEMNNSIVVPSFTIDGVKKFFVEAGFVDVDVATMDEKVYMEFGGQKIWRTVIFARGRRPSEGETEGKSEL